MVRLWILGREMMAPVEVLYTPVAGTTPGPVFDRDGDKMKKYDLEDMRKTPNRFYVESGKKAENGYSFVRTPSPAPGVDESPFITWGEIEGTPLRLEAEDTPIDIGGSGDGPHFKIPSAPTRDVKAHELSREASRKLRERSKMFQKPPLPSPYRAGSASPSVKMLSPAAQKFMRNAIAKSSSSVDDALRASYRGSSPVVGTPKGGRSVSRLGRDGSMSSRSPSVREGSNPPW
ncbi:protein DGCR14-like [Melia azedarach]|uniref:Protein DGCR14-like n=1 Tax=Melia azedarach TaxID=155640 RepID=A0ACC1Z3F1_MELAZ|nr:protein DGCR14-like [Melia azedarach]